MYTADFETAKLMSYPNISKLWRFGIWLNRAACGMLPLQGIADSPLRLVVLMFGANMARNTVLGWLIIPIAWIISTGDVSGQMLHFRSQFPAYKYAQQYQPLLTEIYVRWIGQMTEVWLSGDIAGRINKVDLRRAGLVLRWVTNRRHTHTHTHTRQFPT